MPTFWNTKTKTPEEEYNMCGGVMNATPTMLRNALGLSEAVQIIPGLYIGSVVDGTSDAFLRDHDISMVINCTKQKNHQDQTRGYYQVPVDDDLSAHEVQKMYEAFPDVVGVIDDCMKNQNNVLVHCWAGRQRSASVVCAYLMWRYGTPLDTSIRRLRRRKPDVFTPSVNFRDALQMWRHHHQSRCVISPDTSEMTVLHCSDGGNFRASHDNRLTMTDERLLDPDQSMIPAE
jgi:protein-tyrosine phosphatase